MAQVCPACGAENPDGFRHCGFCGAALAAPVAERRRLATLVFCDLVGSTALGERVDPEAVKELLGMYFAEMRAALERHGGVVEKFIGDAVVGVFGVPVSHEDDALRACRAALEMQARLGALNPELNRRFGVGLEVRIGVNSGGVVGSRETFVTGDAANVAARLEQAAASGEVLLGVTTYRLVRGAVRVEPLGPVEAKGKSVPVAAFRLLELAGEQLGSRWKSRLVGRAEELAALDREFEQTVAEGRCRLVTVVGEPGVGKSRLVAELAERIGPRARVVRGACLSYGEGITFWAVAQIVRELAGIRDEDSAVQAREKLPPGLAQLLGLSEGTMTADETSGAIAEFLGSSAAERPLLVLVDDVHWAEPTLLDLLRELPALIGEAPLLLVCLARPELLERNPAWAVTLRLEPLGAMEVDALLEQLEAPPSVRVRIAQTIGGNPLFAEELVAWVREGGALEELPASLNALLGARLDQLDPEARDALERGAVEGELFHQAAVLELTEQPFRPTVPEGLDELSRKDMIRLTAASLAGEMIAYRFKHILVRDAAYRATTKKLRASLHELYAGWLEQRAGGRVGEYHEILGYHLETAYRYRAELGETDPALALRAGHHLGAAGRQANARADVRAAATLLRRATALLPAESVERLELLNELAYAVDQAGLMREARAIAEELYEQATTLGERRLAAHGKSYATPNPFFDHEADPVAAQAAYEEVIATFTELGDEAGLAAAKRRLARAGSAEGRNAQSTALLEEALVHADASGDQATRRAVAFSLASDLTFGPAQVDAAIPRCEQLLETSRGDRVLEAAIGRRLAELLAMAGRFDEARDYLASAAPMLDEAWVESASWGSLGSSSRARRLIGDHEGAERDLKAKSRAYPVEEGKPQALGINSAYELASLYCDQGRWAEAEGCIARYRGERPKGDVEARLAAHHGRLDEALTLAEDAVERWEKTDSLNRRAQAWLGLAEVQRAAGKPTDADASVEKAIALYEQKGNLAATELLRTARANV
jgi:class 3 adenylate cyclase/tetratricopeptide (TPR) repeat protein